MFSKTKCYFTLNGPQYSVNITFTCIGKPKNSCDSLYHDSHFIAVFWNQTYNISEVCLYSLFLPLNLSYHLVSFPCLNIASFPTFSLCYYCYMYHLFYISSTIFIFTVLCNCLLNQLREYQRKYIFILLFIVIYIITFTGALCFFILPSSSILKTSFSISCKAGLLTTNYLNLFFLTDNLFFTYFQRIVRWV